MINPALIYGMALTELPTTAHISTRFSPGDRLRDEPEFIHLQGRRTCQVRFIIYGSARKSFLQMLDPIHNQGLRLALGAFRTSLVASLFVEAD